MQKRRVHAGISLAQSMPEWQHSQLILYKSDVDEISNPGYNYDWGRLTTRYCGQGLRNSTLSAQMPSESSSVVSNATNGIEAPSGYLSIKKSKKGPLKQIVPGYQHLKNSYTLLWDMLDNSEHINIVSVMQKFFDQAISGNWSYNPKTMLTMKFLYLNGSRIFCGHISSVGRLVTIKIPTTLSLMKT